ncbi:coproporphyrinogen-III oxidase family protein [Saccharothrix variisporea]|uniref:coproporphyrinogen-III oxidase family protein n=1 Tax=Saccharothrix variisporea TaxID=543527 RepID=UPI0014768DE3|nr:coproporphyrinogen-III oxidase family protein [Saccharothrix variisporea]
MRRRIKEDNDQLVLDPATSDRIETAYRSIDWAGLSEAGFDKRGDYCFIYSYPPVRTLKPITSEDIFRPSEWEPVRDRVSLYLHIPYCSGICSYCYFAKVVDNGNSPIAKEDYPDLLIRELEQKMARYNPNAVISNVHIGGGTPSILENHQMDKILKYLFSLNTAPDLEITVECAPETVHDDLDKLKAMRDGGVNRISVGVESLDDRVLKVMARRHGSDMTLRSLENVRAAGFDNVNADLIYALPAQTLASWVDTLNEIAKWQLESVTVYRLRLHPMKRISKLEAELYPSYEDGLKMQLAHSMLMQDAGYLRVTSQKYVSDRKKTQRQPEQKRGVSSAQLLSAGCGAYGFLNSTFYWNTKSLGEWGARMRDGEIPVWMGRVLDKDEIMRKSFVLGVHTSGGIDRQAFHAKFGVDCMDQYAEEISVAVRHGLLEVTDTAVRPTELGYFFGDELSVHFYSPLVKAELAEIGMKYGMFFDQDQYA